jgi:hypothetical protein
MVPVMLGVVGTEVSTIMAWVMVGIAYEVPFEIGEAPIGEEATSTAGVGDDVLAAVLM